MDKARFGICPQTKADKLKVWNSGRCFHCYDYYACQETLIAYTERQRERERQERIKELEDARNIM